MGKFVIQSPNYHGDEDWSKEIKAWDHEEAAEKWAEEHDSQGDYPVMDSRGDGYGPVLVKQVDPPTETIKKMRIFGEMTASYSAREITKETEANL